ncbi:hypothetical protein [Paenibacillus glycinis]|uniref:Uncharacterized protein n=1 Tax=Paenibacillus glycinis TaxID=2697035 RepID=A0ABW9XQ17_9BACL|nr:hypothetical protein [Paenibacillus glycinis]NBD24479.1 hypothetical protein [Paenibacillus glycinis]
MMAADDMPVPYFEIAADYRIRAVSAAASAIFPPVPDWRELLDAGSRDKAASLVAPSHSGMKVELNLRAAGRPAALFDVYQSWSGDGTGHLVCIGRQHRFDAASEQLRLLRETLERDGEAGGGRREPARRPEPIARPEERDVRAALETIGELVELLRPSLTELHKADFADSIQAHIRLALEAAAPEG